MCGGDFFWGGGLQDPGRIPRTIECELLQDLVDSVVPGDLVTVSGIVKSVHTEVRARHGRRSPPSSPPSWPCACAPPPV
jgi:hypothetical protein